MRASTLAVTVAAAALVASCSSSSTPVASRSTTPTPAPSPTLTLAPSPSTTPTPEPTASGGPEDPLSPQPAFESPAPVGQPQCKAAAVTVTDADTLVTPQWKHEVFVLRTTGAPCQFNGYPKVTLMGPDGKALPIRTQAGGFGLKAEKPTAVTLSRTTSLSFSIATSRDGSCTDVGSILATLPGTTTAKRATTELRVCGTVVGLTPVHRLGDDE